MKHKKQVARLVALQNWWDNQSQAYQKATTRPGSIKKAGHKMAPKR